MGSQNLLMMSTYTQILYQFVFSTKYRHKVLIKHDREKLFRYINGILHRKKCVLYAINGVEDHLHIATHVHPTIAVSNLIKDIKIASSLWIKKNRYFPGFKEWQIGYGAFTYSIKAKRSLVNYVKNQERHHQKETFRDEYIRILKEHQIGFEERFLL